MTTPQAELELLAKRLYVAYQEQHAINLAHYGANYSAPPTLDGCRVEMGLPTVEKQNQEVSNDSAPF